MAMLFILCWRQALDACSADYSLSRGLLMCLISEHVISRTAELNPIFYIRLCIKYQRSETLFHPYRNIFRLITMTVKCLIST